MQRVAAVWIVAPLLGACGSTPGTGTPDVGASLRLVAGGGQSQVAGYQLPDTIVVRLADATDQPLAFAPIDAVVDATDEAPFASVTSIDARTRADGTARFTWRLGLALGPQTLRVASGATAGVEPLTVTATATTNRLRALGGSDDGLCALDLAGRLGCWEPLVDVVHPSALVLHPTDQRFTALAMYRFRSGSHRGCAVATTARIWCFDLDGATVRNLAEVPGSYPALGGITTGSSDLDANPPFCGLAADGAAWCWGSNADGVLGDGSTTDRGVPGPVATAVRFTKVAVGSRHACGLAAAGSIWCWGSNDAAQVGLAAGSVPITTPRRIIESISFSDVAVVTNHATCGVGIGGGGAWCWGRKLDLGIGPLAIGLIDGPSTPQAIYLSDLVSPLALGRLDDAVVAVGPPGNAAWWGDLTADVELITTIVPRRFVRSPGFRSLAMPASSGIVCGATTGGDDALLCGRITALTGYRSHGVSPEFAGFGVPFP